MSVKAIGWAFEQEIDDPGAKLVLLAMADSSNPDHGGTWISCRTIMEKTSMGERTVRRKIGDLEKLGKIKSSQRFRGNGSQTTNFYHLACFQKSDLAKLAPPPDAKRSDLAPLDPSTSPSSLRSDGSLFQEDSLFPDTTPVNASSPARGTKRYFGPDEKQILEFFERFWKKYPNKVGMEKTAEKFKKIFRAGKVTMEELMEGLDRYIRTKPPDRPWCNPHTWLHQGRWSDQLAKPDSHAHRNIDHVMR